MASGAQGKKRAPGYWRRFIGWVCIISLFPGYLGFAAWVYENPAIGSISSYGQTDSRPSIALSSSLASTFQTSDYRSPELEDVFGVEARTSDRRPLLGRTAVDDFVGVTLQEQREYAGSLYRFSEETSGAWTQPVVVAHPQVAEALQQAGIATSTSSGWQFDVRAYMDAVDEGLQWQQIPGSGNNGDVLITSDSFLTRADASLAFLSIIMALVGDLQPQDEWGNPTDEQSDRVNSYFLPEDERPGDSYNTAPSQVSAAMTAFLTQGASQVPFALSTEAEYINVALNPQLGTIPEGTVVMALTPSRILEAQFGQFVRLDTNLAPLTSNGMTASLQEFFASKGWQISNESLLEQSAAGVAGVPLPRPSELSEPVNSELLSDPQGWVR